MDFEEIELNELPQSVWNNEEKDYLNGMKETFQDKDFSLKSKMRSNPQPDKISLGGLPSIDINKKFKAPSLKASENKVNKFMW